MKNLVFFFLLMMVLGCGSLQTPNYIRADHPYIRKISGDYSKIINTVRNVLIEEGWRIQEEVNPSEYERRSEDQSRDVLLLTSLKKYYKVLYSTYTHLNVYVHATADGAEVDIRYEAFISGPVKHSSVRNDRLANDLLNKIEQNIESK